MVSWVQKLKAGNKKKRQNQMKRCLHKYKEISLKATNKSDENNMFSATTYLTGSSLSIHANALTCCSQ